MVKIMRSREVVEVAPPVSCDQFILNFAAQEAGIIRRHRRNLWLWRTMSCAAALIVMTGTFLYHRSSRLRTVEVEQLAYSDWGNWEEFEQKSYNLGRQLLAENLTSDLTAF